MKSRNNHSIPEITFLTVFFLACFAFFQFFLPYQLFFEEQLQIFLLTTGHFLEYFSKPAALANYTGDFLTQFFYLRGGGSVVITITLLALWISVKTLIEKLSGKNTYLLLTLIPVIFSWIALCGAEHPLSAAAGLIIGVAITLIYLSINNLRLSFIIGLILLPLTYLAAGSSFCILALVIMIRELRNGSAGRFLRTFVIALITFLIPLILRESYNLTLVQAYTWLSVMTKNDVIINLLPLTSLVLVIGLTVLINGRLIGSTNSLFSILIQALFSAAILVPGIFLTADFSKEKILRLDYEASRNRWDKVYDLSVSYDMHNPVSAYYTNLAMSQLGVLPDSLMQHYQPAATGLFIPVDAYGNYLTITFSNEVYWQLGDVNASQHSALLGVIFSPRSENSRLMKRLVEINIVNGEYAVAGKFITILEKTMFHRKWARGMRNYLFNEEACLASEWITGKRSVIPERDLLKKGNEYILTLQMLLDNHPENLMAADYLLCFHLLSKDISSFARDFEKYYSPANHVLLPRVYKEGLLIWIASGRGSNEIFRKYIIQPEILRDFSEYTRIYEENQGHGAPLQEKYGKTYWFYFHYATMKNE
jgi:hypothetical protein